MLRQLLELFGSVGEPASILARHDRAGAEASHRESRRTQKQLPDPVFN